MEGKSTHVAEKSGSTTATISGTCKKKLNVIFKKKLVFILIIFLAKTMTRVAHTPTVDANRAPKIVSDGTVISIFIHLHL